MAGDGDLEVSPAAVKNIQDGLRAAIGELRESGDAAGASMGAGFENLAMTGMEAGHAGLATDFEDFCERWEWGVRSLVQNASTLAQSLGIAAGTVWEEEQYLHGTFRVVANAAYGNPHASEDEIEKKPWGEISSADIYKPDYSAESFEKSSEQIRQTWSDTGDTVTSTGRIGSLKDLLDQAKRDGDGH
ncbi:hypothetical protein [Streptomyces antarcticus]|uniref:hypothetical protein n=1 Tax=Streptomyces antarcticus TaxID=2996458 RepID=UPI00226F3BA0|nr:MULTISPECIES: hypothetical protein [unclassified Streptomyces]MCY0946706.1 hypothetical protein [Streptomyces sp. H34-AA3]MCZ4085148.1 hypothetical protein [Streptomyces sp. H34-S5]